MPSRYPMMFIDKCNKGVRRNIVMRMGRVSVSENQFGEINRTNSRDPITKSSWSNRGIEVPRDTPNDLFRKDAAASPSKDPIGRDKMTSTGNIGNSRLDIEDSDWFVAFNSSAVKIPNNIPDIDPRMVFPSPRSLFPRQEYRRSKGVPPPKIAAALLGIYAGNMIHKDRNISERGSTI